MIDQNFIVYYFFFVRVSIDVKMLTGWQDGLKCFARSFAVRFVGKCETFESRLHITNEETINPFSLPLGQWLSGCTWDCCDWLKSRETSGYWSNWRDREIAESWRDWNLNVMSASLKHFLSNFPENVRFLKFVSLIMKWNCTLRQEHTVYGEEKKYLSTS